MKTVNGHICQTYQEACCALGLLDHANEHEHCFDEAVQQRSLDPGQLRCLLLVLALDGAPVKTIFDKYEEQLSADFRQTMPHEAARNAVLEYLFAGLIHGGKNPLDYGLPQPSTRFSELDAERLRWNPDACGWFVSDNLRLLNDEQREGYVKIVAAVNDIPCNKTFLVHGKAGTGKTFLLKLVLAYVRSKGEIALACATTSLAALNYDGANTAHSLFEIPVQDEHSQEEVLACNVSGISQRADLERASKIIIWDEICSAKCQMYKSAHVRNVDINAVGGTN